MDTTSNLNSIIEWDIPNWSIALQYWSKNTFHDFHDFHDLQSINALEIGGKHGGLSLWLALNGIKVLCTDLSGPSNEAIEKHVKFNVSHLISYEALNALSIPYCDYFDIVLFKSVLVAIGISGRDNQAKAIQEIYKSLRKGGELWFAENLVASPFHMFFRKRYTEWGNKLRYLTAKDINQFLSIFSEFKYTTVGFLGTFGRTSLQRSLLGRIDRVIVDRLVPSSWRYIIVGVARK